jgi:hypothetical protein
LYDLLLTGFKGPIKRSQFLDYARWTQAKLEDDARDFLKQLLNPNARLRLGSYNSGRAKTGWWVLCDSGNLPTILTPLLLQARSPLPPIPLQGDRRRTNHCGGSETSLGVQRSDYLCDQGQKAARRRLSVKAKPAPVKQKAIDALALSVKEPYNIFIDAGVA